MANKNTKNIKNTTQNCISCPPPRKIAYDKKRRDITFCTMLFRMPGRQNLDKFTTRRFQDFYLASLKQLIETFERVALWCDRETAEFLTANGLADKINMRVMDFSDLPHYGERDEWLQILESMRKNVGYFLHRKTPQQWIDYLILIMAKPAVMDWAAQNNKFNSDYFMWVDAGAMAPTYDGCWQDWPGKIDARPGGARITVAPTLGKSHPHFVPKFVYSLYKKFCPPIADITPQSAARQNLTDIAMINADYDVPAACFMVPRDRVHEFYTTFERTRRIMQRHNLVSTEQAVFQAMMKFDVDSLFEICYIRGYTGVYTAVARQNPDIIF
ncbi:hypothetical protein HDR63_02525 [bacterium]|nr:hypothetical protein [bacterium]